MTRGRTMMTGATGLLLAMAMSASRAGAGQAIVGSSAPEFTLTDTNGRARSLSEFRDRVVVLEWSNHECPFVRKHYDSGNMQRLQADSSQRGVVWLTIVPPPTRRMSPARRTTCSRR